MTPGERERLYLLAEECAEVIQMVNKTLRHGYANYHPDDPEKVSNRIRLHEEVADVQAVLSMLHDENDIPVITSKSVMERKAKKLKYTYYQGTR